MRICGCLQSLDGVLVPGFFCVWDVLSFTVSLMVFRVCVCVLCVQVSGCQMFQGVEAFSLFEVKCSQGGSGCSGLQGKELRFLH